MKNKNLNKDFLDIRHVRIIDSLPIYEAKKEVLTVGCGSGVIDAYLEKIGYDVTSTDWIVEENLSQIEHFSERRKSFNIELEVLHGNIFDLTTFEKNAYESVICSEVLEHLPGYKVAFNNLLQLTQKRLIITVPFAKSFDDPAPPPRGHCNYWNDNGDNGFKSILEFAEYSKPYNILISKIRTKRQDVNTGSFCYLIIIDKENSVR